ncbi:hypothetical protein ABZ478_06910 [Streptomyces sp. NPDC005706]|uniref:hypothetical protein n=1 Tax=Streptomyces sp. NPDC005706 TaxID=3157169 RepID=UPI0033E7631F
MNGDRGGRAGDPAKRGSRFGPWSTAAAVGVLAVACVVAWQLWPSDDADVAVPARVCDDALPGADVAALLPENGKPFTQWHAGVLNPEHPYTGEPSYVVVELKQWSQAEPDEDDPALCRIDTYAHPTLVKFLRPAGLNEPAMKG